MVELRTVPEGLDRAAERAGAGFTFVADDGIEDEWSFARLAKRAREVAVAMVERGMSKGDRVALILPSAVDFIPAFLGVQQGGGVPVPLYPPMGLGQLGGYLDHAQHIVGASKSSHVITTGQIRAVIGKVREAVPTVKGMLTVADLEGDASLFRDPGLDLEDPCFLQFTSGSTARPKGVVITHGNLAHNCHAIMTHGLETDDEDRGLSWLPLFHDMGLIGFVLAPIHHRVPITFLSPLMFLKKPATWLTYLSQHRGTITYGPNFAYAIATKRVRNEEIAGIDLSKVRIAGCGAEPIQAETLRAFVRRFGDYGFREEALVPSYGMAEHTLAISFARGIPTDRVLAEDLWGDGNAVPVGEQQDDVEVLEIVGCGRAFPGHRIRIVDNETRVSLADRQVGEIELDGPSVTAGYFEDGAATEASRSTDGWLRTGDLGYLVDGQVFICGRAKDVIIINGKNYYPQDLEWAAAEVEGIRPGNVLAFPTRQEGLDREAVVVVAETRDAHNSAPLAAAVKKKIYDLLGLMVDEVVVAEVGTILKTSSGKLQRGKTRAAYETGSLGPRRGEGAVKVAGRLVQSQLAHLKLSIFK